MMPKIAPYLFYTALILLALFFQAEIFPALQIFGAKPDLLMLLVVFAAIHTDWKSGLIVGLMAGFWLDLLLGSYFGLNMIVYGLIGTALGYSRRFVDLTPYYVSFFAVLAATVVGSLVLLLLFKLVGATLPTAQAVQGIIVPMTFYNLLLVVIALPFVLLRRRRGGLKITGVDLFGGGVTLSRNDRPRREERPLRPRAAARLTDRADYDENREAPGDVSDIAPRIDNDNTAPADDKAPRRRSGRYSRDRYRRK